MSNGETRVVAVSCGQEPRMTRWRITWDEPRAGRPAKRRVATAPWVRPSDDGIRFLYKGGDLVVETFSLVALIKEEVDRP